MFCNQCEQTRLGAGCNSSPGICGKNEDIQSLQETLLYGLKGMAAYAHHTRRLGQPPRPSSARTCSPFSRRDTRSAWPVPAPPRISRS